MNSACPPLRRQNVVPVLTTGEKACLIAAATGLLLLPGQRLWAEWASNPNCEHVGIALPVALFLLISRLRETSGAQPKPAWGFGGGMLLLSLSLLVLDAILGEVFILGVALWVGALGSLAVLGGRALLSRALFPFLLLAFAIPPPYSLARSMVHIHLQRYSAFGAEFILTLLGLAPARVGTVLQIDGKFLNVEEACSGLKFTTSMLFISLVAGSVLIPKALRGRALLAATAVVVAMLANSVRLAWAGVIARRSGMEAVDDFLHGWSVYPLYLLAVGIMLAMSYWIRQLLRQRVVLDENLQEIT